MCIDQLFALLLFGISTVGILGSFSLDLIVENNIGPGFMPFICSSVLLVCSFCLFFGDRQQKKIRWKDLFKKPLSDSMFFYGMIIVFYLIAGYLGMICSLCIFSTTVLIQQGQLKKRQILLFEVIFMALIYLIFTIFLKIPFEHGILFT